MEKDFRPGDDGEEAGLSGQTREGRIFVPASNVWESGPARRRWA